MVGTASRLGFNTVVGCNQNPRTGRLRPRVFGMAGVRITLNPKPYTLNPKPKSLKSLITQIELTFRRDGQMLELRA